MKIKSQVLSPRVMEDLKKRSVIGLGFYLVAAFTVLGADGYYTRHSLFSIVWIFFLGGICLFRLVHFLLDGRLPQNRFNRFVFSASVMVTALIWGIGYAWFTCWEKELNVEVLMVICTTGLCSGGVVAFAPFLWLSLGFNFFILMPGIAAHVFYTGNLYLGLLMFLFFAYMAFMALRQNTEYQTALENESLLEQKTKQLERISNRDGLTGLYNRRYFDRTFSYEWKRALRKSDFLVIMICDVDHFKRVNDQYGHLAGDEYLKRIAGLLQAVFKRETDTVARYGGEEFVALMPGDTVENAQCLAEKLRTAVASTPLDFEGHSIYSTISLGLAGRVPEPGMACRLLVADADRALYRAKTSGRNRTCVIPSCPGSP